MAQSRSGPWKGKYLLPFRAWVKAHNSLMNLRTWELRSQVQAESNYQVLMKKENCSEKVVSVKATGGGLGKEGGYFTYLSCPSFVLGT